MPHHLESLPLQLLVDMLAEQTQKFSLMRQTGIEEDIAQCRNEIILLQAAIEMRKATPFMQQSPSPNTEPRPAT
jgi:hypothetical protein